MITDLRGKIPSVSRAEAEPNREIEIPSGLLVRQTCANPVEPRRTQPRRDEERASATGLRESGRDMRRRNGLKT